MPQFIYKAKDTKGALIEGAMEAEGRPAVVSRLQQMGYFPVSIEGAQRQGGKIVATKPQTSLSLPKLNATSAAEGRPSGRRVRTADLAAFNRQLADLLGAGIPLVRAFSILAKQGGSDALMDIVTAINSDVQGGATFADALARHPRVFSKLYVAMVRSGEAGGMLDNVLQRLADYSESEEQLRSRVKSALAYPVVMVVAGSGAVTVMFTYVVPKIVATFKELNQTLPLPTQILIAASDWVQAWWPGIILGVFGVVFGGWQFLKTREGLGLWHRLELNLPVFGPLIRKREVARFCRTLGSLLRNGVSILTALEIVREIATNSLVKSEVARVVDEITQGAGIAEPLKNSKIFPAVAVNMMAVGEETGRLPDVLLRISDSYEIEVDRNMKTLTSLIEPLIIVAMGLVVGFVVISMLLPIFSLDPTGGQ